MSEAVRVEVWADVQCIWCYVGDARWKQAAGQFAGEVEFVHRAFELQPGSPADFDAQAYLQSQRGMTPADQERAFGAIKQVAKAEGLEYLPERIRPTNSHLALELLHHAGQEGARDVLSDRLYAAYFAEGRHVGRVDELVELAGEAGLDRQRARAALDARTHAETVDREAARARSLGVQGVPFSVLNDTYAISGAQRTEVLLDALNRAAA
ncbi:DsbA family oxidoreductase [Amycolatopsis jejuensis]|uniref:DsbA family oxidoreductase n=1 Tax=Amycolatopsis jejuensis TaxID=330084 RepID=UPI0005279CE7|nr:DsbA family oxidoreductase [Amycolatopsis jejuensis]